MARDQGVEGDRAVATPITKEVEATMARDPGERLSSEAHGLYRRGLGQLQWLLPRRPEIAYALKVVSRRAAEPTDADAAALRRIARYLAATSDQVLTLCVGGAGVAGHGQHGQQGQQGQHRLTVHSDADWAGCTATRRSTSAWVIKIGEYTVAFGCRLQPFITYSSCESELVAMHAGWLEGRFFQNAAAELDMQLKLELYSDSSSALAVARRIGPGKLRHIDVRILGLQAALREGQFETFKVASADNRADGGTKALGTDDFVDFRAGLGVIDPPGWLKTRLKKEQVAKSQLEVNQLEMGTSRKIQLDMNQLDTNTSRKIQLGANQLDTNSLRTIQRDMNLLETNSLRNIPQVANQWETHSAMKIPRVRNKGEAHSAMKIPQVENQWDTNSAMKIPQVENQWDTNFSKKIPRVVNQGEADFSTMIPRVVSKGESNFSMKIPQDVNQGDANLSMKFPQDVNQGDADLSTKIPQVVNQGTAHSLTKNPPVKRNDSHQRKYSIGDNR